MSANDSTANHEKGIKAVPAKPEWQGCQPISPRMDAGVKVFEFNVVEK